MYRKGAVNLQRNYGIYGGRYVPEMLITPLDELSEAFVAALDDAAFIDELNTIQKTYNGRPSPLYLAENLSAFVREKTKLNSQLSIYLKLEHLNHTGAHKMNNVLGQVLLAKYMGKKKVVAETGAGQHGLATAAACARFGMECCIFMGETDIRRQYPNVYSMKLMGAKIVSISDGNGTLKDAVNAAMKHWIESASDTFYILGSALGPSPYPQMVQYFQSIIGQELRWQLQELCIEQENKAKAGKNRSSTSSRKSARTAASTAASARAAAAPAAARAPAAAPAAAASEEHGSTSRRTQASEASDLTRKKAAGRKGEEYLPDLIMACVGGGSNALGIFTAFLEDDTVSLLGVEAGGLGVRTKQHAARLQGSAAVGISQGYKSYFLQNKDGQIADTYSISAGLDYAGISPQLAYYHDQGRVHMHSASDAQALEGYTLLSRLEGITPALESAHALGLLQRLNAALRRMKMSERRIRSLKRVVVNVSGRGDKDIFITASALDANNWHRFLKEQLPDD